MEGAYTTCNQQSREKERKKEKEEGGRLNHTFELVDLERARSYLHLKFVLRNCLHACDFIALRTYNADARLFPSRSARQRSNR